MRYKVNFRAGTFEKSFNYFCFSGNDRNGVLYDITMAGKESATMKYYLEREGYYTYLLSYTLNGTGIMDYHDATYEVNAGDLVFIDCNRHHKFYPKAEGWEFVYLHVTGPGLTDLYDSFVAATGNVLRGYEGKIFLEKTEELNRYLSALSKKQVNSLDHHIDLSAEDICRTSAVIYPIFTEIALCISSLNTGMPYPMQTALEFIRKNFNTDISLEDAAKAACMSKYHFERQFKKHMNMTFFQYVTELRFEKARQLLKTTSMNILDVALSVGYSDMQALNKLFKRNLGTTPAAFRKGKYTYHQSNETAHPAESSN